MPHLIIEYPQDAVEANRVDAMLKAVHAAVVATDLFDESHIRLRTFPLTHYLAGGRHVPFIHVQCRLHTGRDNAQKSRLSRSVVEAIRHQALPIEVITAEVVEMDRSTYAKYPD